METANRKLVDSFGRRVKTLRISLTDRCNFRCVYCMPPEGLPLLDKSRFLEIEDIARFVRIIGRIGVGRVRLTGGEPLLREDVVEIVAALRRIDTVEELSLTTNGSRLAALARRLREAGLDRINVSLDSLDSERFREVTRAAQCERVIEGIEAADREGFPLKLNIVVLNGMTEDEINRFARFAMSRDIDVRFLEFMPLCGSGWQADLVYPIARVRDIVRRQLDLVALPREDAPAETFSVVGGKGRVGFIAPLSEPFCDACSRIRLTAEGQIRPCLFSDYQVAVGPMLKNGASDKDIEETIRSTIWQKPWGSEFADEPFDKGKSGKRAAPTPFIRSIGG